MATNVNYCLIFYASYEQTENYCVICIVRKMRNKLIISSFALVLCFSAWSQNRGGLQESDISVYPNPASEFIVVQLDTDSKTTRLELNSMIGNKLVIKPEEIGYGKYKIQVKDLATGYYFLIVKDEAKRFKKAFKFLKR